MPIIVFLMPIIFFDVYPGNLPDQVAVVQAIAVEAVVAAAAAVVARLD